TASAAIYPLSLHDALPIFEEVDGAGCATAGGGVHQEHGVVAVEHPVGQMHPADTGVDDLDVFGQGVCGQPADGLDAEAVVAEERSEEHTSELQSHLNLVLR